MVSADKALDAAKWVGIGAAALGVAYVLYRVIKLGEGVSDAVNATVAAAKEKIDGAIAAVKDPSGGKSYGSALDLARRQMDPTSPDYVPDWKERSGVTVNQYGDYGFGDMYAPATGE